MSWWGKIIGGTLGFAIGGPIGALLGAALGHAFDAPGPSVTKSSYSGGGYSNADQERIQTAFFTATFSIMGYLAKSDGHVSQAEIDMAKAVFERMNLDPKQRKLAIDLFNQGKKPDFPFNDILSQFKQECHRRQNIMRMFLSILVQSAFADGALHSNEEKILRRIAGFLNISAIELSTMIAMTRQAQTGTGGGQQGYRQYQSSFTPADELNNAYKVLGISKSADDAEVKRAYRRMMSQNHPDKLVSKGMPEEMIEIATEKTKQIQKAYDLIKQSRKNH